MTPERVREADAFFEEGWGPPAPTGSVADLDFEDWWPDEAAPSSSARDASAAVIPFSPTERARIEPLLGAAAVASATAWNRNAHPGVSQLSAADIQAALADYVDFDALRGALDEHDRIDPPHAIPRGTPPFDALLVAAIHQFQRKCYFDPARHDGRADASVLDSLGFVRRGGLRSNRGVNRAASRRLARQPITRLTGGELDSNDWFRFILDPTFLGWTFVSGGSRATGIHLLLVRKLRVAERWLLRRRHLEGSTPVALGRALSFSETSEIHRGFRPSSSGLSFHTFGLAMDVKYQGNPFVRGRDFTRTLRRAVLLVSGTVLRRGTSNQYLHSLGSDPNQTTEKIYDILASHDADFVTYMNLPEQPDVLRELLVERQADGTADVFAPRETIDAAVRRWTKRAEGDRRAMKGSRSPFRTNSWGLRDIYAGFLSLPRDLVIALRDHACLAWGAVDLGAGPKGSGDIMHFDARVCGVGGRLPAGGQRSVDRGHPCLPCRSDDPPR